MYIEHYGLTGQPFQLTPDARFWFDSRTHRKAMAYLGYGLAQGEGFIVVTGEIGAGKSTLVAHLMANIDRARLNAISLVSTQVEGDDMLRLVAQGLGLDTDGVEKARLLDAIEQRLDEEARAGKRTLLIVDEAQNLPVSALEELRMLSNFQVGGQRAAADLPARPARVPRQARRRRASSSCASGSSPPTISSDGRRRGRALYPPPPDPGRLAGQSRLRARTPSPRSTATAAAFRAGSTSSPTGCCSTPRSRAPRRSAPTRSRRSPPTWAPIAGRRRPQPRAAKRRCCRCARPRPSPVAAADEPAPRTAASRSRARAPDRRARSARRGAGGDASPRPDPARRLGRERPADAGAIAPHAA